MSESKIPEVFSNKQQIKARVAYIGTVFPCALDSAQGTGEHSVLAVSSSLEGDSRGPVARSIRSRQSGCDSGFPPRQ
jgi:hypothetical protein